MEVKLPPLYEVMMDQQPDDATPPDEKAHSQVTLQWIVDLREGICELGLFLFWFGLVIVQSEYDIRNEDIMYIEHTDRQKTL